MPTFTLVISFLLRKEYPMKGIKGSVKQFGDPCARCGVVLTEENSLVRSPPRSGLLSYCRSCTNEKARAWRANNKEKVSQKNKAYRARLKKDVLDAYGGACSCCGETTPEFLAIDHIGGGGNAERQRLNINSGWQMALHVRKRGFPDSYRILCHNCNQAIGWYGRCPHADS